MKKIADILTFELEAAFEKAGYDKQYAKVTLSNRPDLCEYQCNGAMAAAKAYKKAPIMIANDVVEVLKESACIEQVEAVNPGFINIILDGEFVASYLGKMSEQEKLGVEEPKKQKTIIVDYGGANVAKPLHVGHLRSAVIGESVKRIGKYVGHKMIGDVHLGDWGYQMGLVITELKRENRSFHILTISLKENIQKNHRLRLPSWKRFIRQRVHTQKNMKIIKKKHCRRHSYCRTGIEDTLQSGNTL